MKRRDFTISTALLGLVGFHQDSQIKITIVAPYPAGGSVDYCARVLEKELNTTQTFSSQVLNIPGADGMMAVNHARYSADIGQTTLLMAGNTQFSLASTLNPNFKGLRLESFFKPLSILWEEPFYMVVNSNSEFENINEILHKVNSNKKYSNISFGTAGPRSSSGLFIDNFFKKQKVDLIHVPYKGMSEIVVSLLANQIDIGILSYQQAKPFIDTKQFRFLAATGLRRSKLAPLVPTLTELNLSPYGCTAWFGLFLKNSTSQTIFDALDESLAEIFINPRFKESLDSRGFDVLALRRNDAIKYIDNSQLNWKNIVNNFS